MTDRERGASRDPDGRLNALSIVSQTSIVKHGPSRNAAVRVARDNVDNKLLA